MSVESLRGSGELVRVLPLARVSIVLFTALWSFDSAPARGTLERVASRFPSVDAAPNIAFYVVPVHINEVDASPPPQPTISSLRSVLFGQPPAPDRAVYNVTRNIPFFPVLRAFIGSNTGGAEGATPETFTGSFTEIAMRRFVLHVSDRAVQDYGRRLNATRAGAGSAGRISSTGRSPEEQWVVDSQSMLEDMGKDKPEPFDFSPDAFSSLLHGTGKAAASVARKGLMVLVPGGATTMHTLHLWRWRLLIQATSVIEAEAAVPWVATCVDTLRYGEVAERYGLSPSYSSPKLVLVDIEAHNVFTTELPTTPGGAAALLRIFASSQPGSLNVRVVRKDLTYVPLMNEKLLHVGGGEIHSTISQWTHIRSLWLIVHQPWCGFSQRVMAVFQRFATGRKDALVLATSDVENLPWEVDTLVDGYPTILKVEIVADTLENKGRLRCRLGDLETCSRKRVQGKGWSYKEYTGIVSVPALEAAL